MNKIQQAIKTLREYGFQIKPTETKPGVIYLIRQPLLNFKYQYLIRLRRKGRDSLFRKGTEIVRLNTKNMRWKPIHGKDS